MLFLFKIIIFLNDVYLTFSENETLSLNVTAIQNIMTSKISVNKSQVEESKVMNYLYGYSGSNGSDQHLEISVFEPEEVKRLFETAHSKSELVEREFNKSRRFISEPYFITKAFDFMRHSIYGTRYRLKDTLYLRKFFSKDPGYKIALLYGSLMQLRIKMDNIYTTLYKFHKRIKFLWYIVLYERCIAAAVDVDNMVERIFALVKQGKIDLGIDEDYMMMEAEIRKIET